MSIQLSLSSRRRRLWSRFARAQDGATVVEFAIVALPFFALMFGVIELGFLFLVATMLDNATTDAARLIRTGQLQTSGTGTAASFVASICNELTWLPNCTSNMSVNVQTFASFSSMTPTNPVNNGVLANQNTMAFAPGGAAQIVLVQSFYKWKLFVPALDTPATPVNGGSTVITATAVFRNEPY
jgi:Flp pilus assembly protein TadG